MAAALFDDLLTRHAEPHRRYHDTRHLAEVMDAIDRLEDQAEDVEAVRLAAWFHDAVYDPTRDDNEERSAELAASELVALDLPHDRISEVVRLVRLTRTHDPEPGDRNGELLCDADLSILGADPARYAAYAAGVRAEYAHVADDIYAATRAALLAAFLARPTIFHTDPARARWERPARRNVADEIATLTRRDG